MIRVFGGRDQKGWVGEKPYYFHLKSVDKYETFIGGVMRLWLFGRGCATLVDGL